MIVSAYQPYFAPFSGFFSKALRSDTLVLMDAVQFPRGSSWLTRNRFKNDQGTLRITVPVWKKGLGYQKINEVRICHDRQWEKKCLASLKTAYAKAPFFEEHLNFLEDVFSEHFERLIDLNLKLIRYLMDQLQVSVEILLLSKLDIEAREPRLSVDVCRKLGATHFLAQSRAGRYLDQGIFQTAGVRLIFFNPRHLIYPQLWGSFLPNLSAFDMLFNCGPAAQRILKKDKGDP
jgi:hypothetical protein